MRTYSEAQTHIEGRLGGAGWTVTPEALGPLRQIDFAKLVAIHDHEERFLEETFISTLLGLLNARAVATGTSRLVTPDDVETALRMLGVAAARQSQSTLSHDSKAIIKDACGFC